jgi:hypothetical protein
VKPIGLYSGLPYPRVPNTPWGQPNPVGISLQEYFPTQPMNPMFPTHQATQPHMGGPLGFNMPSQPVYGPNGTSMPHLHYHYSQPNRKTPLFSTLDIPYLLRLKNDPIHHAPLWPPIHTKLLFDILKFDEKPGEYPNNHVMALPLWCSFNSMNDSIRLRHFQRMLTRPAEKWYTELPCNSFIDFNSLAMDFLNHFQLPIQYETNTELLNSLRQSTSTHISDHIHEWRQ